MRQKNKIMTGILLTGILCVLSLNGSGVTRAEAVQATDKGDKKVIGVSFASGEASYQEALGTLLKSKAKADSEEYSLQIEYAEWNVSRQEEQMRTFIKDKVDAIILCPVNAKSFLNVLKDAKKAEIPVINLNMKVDTVSTEYISTYVGGSMSEEANLAGELVVECLNGKGKIGIIEGTQGSDPQIYRTQTFLEYMSSYPDIEVVGIVSANWIREKAGLAALDLLNKDKDIDLIYCHDSNMAMGVYKMLEKKGLEKQVKVIGIGSDEEYTKAVKDEKLYGIVTQSSDFEASFAWSCAKRAAEGQNLRAWYKDPAQIVTKKTLDARE